MDTQFDEKYWSERYQNSATGWDIGYCSTPIQTFFSKDQDKNQSALIPGAGFGHEAIYLFEQGFDKVKVVDIALEPLEALKKKCPSFPQEALIHQDFFEHEGQYDLIVEQTFFCALDPKLRED
jgi:thiopurine S-methyltransferase